MLRLTLISLAAVLFCIRPAPAQSLSDMSGPFGLPISSGSVEHYGKLLGLDNDQKQLMRTLYQGYRGALRQAVKAGNEELKGLNGQSGPDRANQGMETLDKFADKHQAIEQEFLSDLKAILKPGQDIEPVNRARRREVQTRFAFIAGEGVDLIAILDKLKVQRNPGTELATTCNDYEAAMDSLMIEKQKVLKASLRRAFKIQKNSMPDFELISSILGDIHSIGGRIRDTNRRFVRLLEPILPEAARTELTSEVRLLTFPRVYAKCTGQKLLEAAKDLSDLTPEQTDEIKSLSQSFAKDLESANQRYAAAIESTQDRLPKDFLMVMQLRNDPESKDPLVLARMERRDLEEKLVTRLQALLKPEFFQKLPKAEKDNDRFPEFIPNMQLNKEFEDINSDQ